MESLRGIASSSGRFSRYVLVSRSMIFQGETGGHHNNQQAALYNITDKGVSTREETLRKIFQQACNSAASRIAEASQDQPVQIGIPNTLRAVVRQRGGDEQGTTPSNWSNNISWCRRRDLIWGHCSFSSIGADFTGFAMNSQSLSPHRRARLSDKE